MSALKDSIIAVSGTHKGYTQAKIEKLVAANGGTFAKTIDDDTTHLVTTEADFGKKSNKVNQALENKIHIVSLEWLTDSIEKKKRQTEKSYAVGDEVDDIKADDKESTPEPEPATNNRGTKRRAAATKKEEPEKEPEPPAKKTKKAPAAKGKAAKEEDDADEPVDEEPEKEAKMKTVIKKGKAPVDDMSGLQNSHHVYVDKSGLVWDACLNQTQLSSNNNKFYYIQLLESDSNNSYTTFTHWGRVGERGQSKLLMSNVALATAEYAFRKQFKSKTGKDWNDRHNATGGPNKYAFLERNYDDDGEDDGDTSANPSSTAETLKIPESKLVQPVQDLVKLIFNQNLMQQSMASLSYDANKLPLGKLSKETILRGYSVLKEIGRVLTDSSIPNKQAQLEQLSGQYYTVIPHDFGRYRPITINTAQLLKRETDLIDNLSEMKITAEIIASTKQAMDINPIDSQYNSLGLNEAEPLDHSSKEFKLLEAYLYKTHGSTHHIKLVVEDIFRITRSSEIDRWNAENYDTIPKFNRKLLWHGSRTTNYSGILSQGLRIAPPEAPVSGYMFDKGIYLADIATKSANYCYANISHNTGLLMLCEAQLGDPMLELKRAAYDAAKQCKDAGRLATKGLGRTAPLMWEDAGVVNPQLKGVMMPKVSGNEKSIIGDSKINDVSLMYNEYIVYNVNQVKIRYLFRCKFEYGRGSY